jgi:serine protease Do
MFISRPSAAPHPAMTLERSPLMTADRIRPRFTTVRLLPCLGALTLAALLAFAPPAAADGPNSFAPLVKRIQPAVVSIRTTETVTGEDPFADLPPEFRQLFSQRFKTQKRRMQGAGSGFVIDPSGYIVTANHVVDHADEIVVAMPDGNDLPAKVVGTDELTDVALIKVSASVSLPYVTWGDSRAVEVGDWVVCAGNPFGLGGTITAGIISARGRDIGSGPFDDFLQIDAPINPGNSGGPVFNMQGQVVGLDTAIASPTGASVGIGFAIPSEIASRIVGELRERGRVERGWLGATLQDVPDSDGHTNIGVGITAVERNGPGQRSGLRPGDIVTAVNGQPVDSSRTLIRAVAETPPGGTVRMMLRRQGREMELSVVVGRRPNGQG